MRNLLPFAIAATLLATAATADPPGQQPEDVNVTNESLDVNVGNSSLNVNVENQSLDVSVTNQSLPVHVVEPYTLLTEQHFNYTALYATAGGFDATFLFNDWTFCTDCIVTELFLAASSSAPETAFGNCEIRIYGNREATGNTPFAAFFVPAGRYGTRTITIPNMYFDGSNPVNEWISGQLVNNVDGTGHDCQAFVELRYRNASAN